MSSLFVKTLGNLASGFLPAAQSCSYDFTENQVEKQASAVQEKIQHYAFNFFKGVGCLMALPFAATLSLLNNLKNKTITHLNSSSHAEPIEPKVLSEEEMIQMLSGSVSNFGFSDSLFQSCGLGTAVSAPTFAGRSDWDEWVQSPEGHIESSKENIKASFRNYLDDPSSFIQLLKDMKVTAYRFSLERAVIEPNKGEYDQIAIQKHVNFCKALKEAGIEPWVTLNHFVQPKWFSDAGGFGNTENVADFVRYCETIIPQFKPHVTNWMTFNELGVDGFQREIRRVYPGGKGGIFAAVEDMRNMLIAHFAVYQKMKVLDPEIKMGITHQWLKFVPANPYNPIERITCYAISLITHYAVFNCFKTGFLQIPFLVNDRLWSLKKPPMDFIGVQSYGFPVLKVGFGSGEEPGQVTKLKIPGLNRYFVAGATCRDIGGKVSSFGPPYSPNDLEAVLQEAEELKVPVAITETGCDARLQAWGKDTVELDEATQKEYFQKMFEILTRFRLEGLFIWTLFKDQLEWEGGTEKMRLGVVSDVKEAESRKIQKWELSPAAKYIQDIFKRIIRMADKQVA